MRFCAIVALFLLIPAGRVRAQGVKPTPAQRIRSLQDALKAHPRDGPICLQLGQAYAAVGDLADAETELRRASLLVPASAEAHNSLGMVLYESGDAKASVEEFHTAVRLAPADPNAHFNLGMALVASGDKAGGEQELKAAATLAPGDEALARVAAVTEQTGGSNAGAPTIKVDVRQVLVPVVITDRQGHHVTGLTQSDFKILEDGVEQKITSFSVEHSGVPETSTAAPPRGSSPALPETAASPAPRRTFVVCIDTLHAGFNNFVSAREALIKLFERERSEDSQYVVVALGTSAQIVLNTTRDPNAVLAALRSKSFQKIFLEGQVGGLRQELDRYRRDLNETRVKCDVAAKTSDKLPQIQCDVGKQRAPQEAQTLAELDRTLMIGFLRQFRNLVGQLATAKDRRTIVLMSDGFQLVPGRQAYELLSAYFPDLKDYSLRAGERLQDEFDPIMKVAARNNIAIDTIDSRGLYGIGTFDASNQGSTITVSSAVDAVDHNIEFTNNSTLSELAQATGGTAFHDSNDLLTGLERAFADGRDFYTIGYVSGNENRDGRFRAVTVQLARRDVVINAKRGYWAEGPAQ